MKECTKCHQVLSYSEYNRDSQKPDGYYSSCKKCKSVKDKKWEINNPEKRKAIIYKYLQSPKGKARAIRATKIYRERYPWKRRCHQNVQDAVKSGRIVVPEACEKCLREHLKLEGHHHNGYSKEHRLDVIWLCRSCHLQQSH